MGLFSSRPAPMPMRTRAAATADFRAVEICADAGACTAARNCAGQRFLASGSVPRIPLLDCDHKSHCTCRYRHHEDRRAGPRRGVELGNPGSGAWIVADRRLAGGRRAGD